MAQGRGEKKQIAEMVGADEQNFLYPGWRGRAARQPCTGELQSPATQSMRKMSLWRYRCGGDGQIGESGIELGIANDELRMTNGTLQNLKPETKV